MLDNLAIISNRENDIDNESTMNSAGMGSDAMSFVNEESKEVQEDDNNKKKPKKKKGKAAGQAKNVEGPANNLRSRIKDY
jgi:hypothetical protein